MHEKQILMYLLDQLASRPIFPRIYDGFREIEELAKGEDALLSIMQDCVRLISDDKLIGLANETKLAEWEEELGLSGQGLSLEERRAQMTAFLGRSRVINDAALLSIARTAAQNDDIEILTDCDRLTCEVRKTENTEDATEGEELRAAYLAVRPAMPQNLSLRAVIPSALSHAVTANHAVHTAIGCHLGHHVPPIPQIITIGVSDTVMAGTSTISSGWWWMDKFGQYSTTLRNVWDPEEYASVLSVQSSQDQTPNGTEYGEVYFWTGSTLIDLGAQGISLYLNMYPDMNGRPELYTNNSSISVQPTDAGIIIAPGSAPTWTVETAWNLPAALYSISGTRLTWNTSHPLFPLFNGRSGIAV